MKKVILENNLRYIKGLNGLRAIAVILVIISHWLPNIKLATMFPIGRIGVDIFFVISGFLISRILFNEKNIADSNFTMKLKAVKNFMIRRTLRIFPIYYLLLLFLYSTNGAEFRNNILYYLTYTTNFFFYNTQSWHGMTAHFWSLSVEEQFYLFWPFLLLFLNKKYLLKFIIFIIVFGSIFSIAIKNGMSFILTLSCLNAFGLGAIYAYIVCYKPFFSQITHRVIRFLFIPLITLLILNFIVFKLSYFPIRLIISFITLNIIRICVEENSKSMIFKFLNFKFLDFIGVISYGLYLFHNPFTNYWRRLFLKIGVQSRIDNIYLDFLIKFSVLVFISYLSWKLLEQPILKLKKYAK